MVCNINIYNTKYIYMICNTNGLILGMFFSMVSLVVSCDICRCAVFSNRSATSRKPSVVGESHVRWGGYTIQSRV